VATGDGKRDYRETIEEHSPCSGRRKPFTPKKQKGRRVAPTALSLFCFCIFWRRRWDSNPRKVALHTLSKRADSAALALLQKCLFCFTNRRRTSKTKCVFFDRQKRLAFGTTPPRRLRVSSSSYESGCRARWLGPAQRDPREPGQGGNAAALSEANWCRRQPGRRAGQPDLREAT
jgi:hypothetical protein